MGSVLAAPMSAGGTVLGALVFVNQRGSREFDAHDLAIATEVARPSRRWRSRARGSPMSAPGSRTRCSASCCRRACPAMPGWEVATMYEPAGEVNEVGGDFYEVFAVEGGWAVVLGDVSGKGAAAAALTAEARHTIRTAGSLAADPVAGPARARREPARARRRRRSARSRCWSSRSRVSSAPTVFVYLAGHPHPILLRGAERDAGRRARAAARGRRGARPGRRSTVALEPGDQLVLYTDGVIEARRDGGERFGTERLRAGLAGCAGPDLAVERVRAALWAFGARAREDDAALVAIRRGAPGALARGSAGAPARRRAPSSTSESTRAASAGASSRSA